MAEAEDQRWVRPYALTKGRTRPTRELPIESLVTGTGADTSDGDTAWFSILELTHEPVSIAEIAARCGYVLGVARVLVADLMDAGLVRVTAGIDDPIADDPSGEQSSSHIALLERVLNGLQSL